MGGGDCCAIYVCSNDRSKSDKAIAMDHVVELTWYGPKDQKNIAKWQKLLNRGGDFKVSKAL